MVLWRLSNNWSLIPNTVHFQILKFSLEVKDTNFIDLISEVLHSDAISVIPISYFTKIALSAQICPLETCYYLKYQDS